MSNILIQWDQMKMGVNIQAIDKQHQALVSLINNLFLAVKEGRSNEIFDKLIQDLVRYAEVHFSEEEKYFQQYQYPDAADHIRKHKEFMQKVQAFQNDFRSGKTGLTRKVLDFLRDWLVNHIILTDRKYTKFLNDQGIH